ncbi:MAG: tetratricopeptide repeat protein [bacterium]
MAHTGARLSWGHRLGWGAALCACLALGLSSPAWARKPGAPGKGAEKDNRRERARKIFEQGQIHFKLGRFDKAKDAYTQAYQILPLAGFLFNIGQCHRNLGNCERAIHFYKGYIRENPGAPNNSVVLFLIKRCEEKLQEKAGKRTKAMADFKEGVRLLALNKVREALAKFMAAYEELPLPGYRYHIAQCHRMLQQWKQAVFYYEGYLKDNPSTPKMGLVESYLKSCKQRLEEEELRRRGILNPNLGSGGKGQSGKKGGGKKVVPLYKRWWLWTLVSVGVAALAVGLGAGLATRSNSSLTPPDTQLGTLDWRF